MATTLMALKVKKYMSKPANPHTLDASLDETITEKTQAQLEEYKASRKLPLLGVNFHRVKERPIPKKKRQNLSALDPVITPDLLEEISFKEISSFILTPSKITTPHETLAKEKSFVQLENMLGEWESQQASAHNRFLSVTPFGRGYTERVSPLLTGNTKEDIQDTAGSFILDKSPQNGSGQQANKEEPQQQQQGTKSIAKYLGFEYNNPYKISTKRGSIRGKPRSRSIPSNPARHLNGANQQSPVEDKSRVITETDMRTRDRKYTMTSSDGSPSPIMGPKKFIRPANKPLSDVSTCASPNISVVKGMNHQDQGTNRLGHENSLSLFSLDKKEQRKEDAEHILETQKDVALGGKIFHHTDILQSKLPLGAIEHPGIPRVKALHANHVLMGRPLQLPLTNVMESVLKKAEIKSMNARSLAPLDEYGKTLLKGTFRDYYHEINPLGRLESQEIELLNGVNEKYRARRGLPITTKHNFNPDFFDGSSENNANKKSQKLLHLLIQAQESERPLEEVIKEHRKEIPIEMNKKFLEISFDTTLNRTEIKESIVNKIKKYDAWYVAPEERKKRYSGVFANLPLQKNKFKYRPSELINVDSIKKISKEFDENVTNPDDVE